MYQQKMRARMDKTTTFTLLKRILNHETKYQSAELDCQDVLSFKNILHGMSKYCTGSM